MPPLEPGPRSGLGGSRPARRWLAAALVLGLGAAACVGRHPAAPGPQTLPVAAGGVPVAPRPAITAPAGVRLAIATAQGMEIWSASTGVYPLGPELDGVVVSRIAWSADGRHLSWQTAAAGGGARGGELWYADLRTGATRHWGPLAPGRTWGPVVVTDTGVLTLGAVVTRYSGAEGVTVAVPSGGARAGASVESWSQGWVIGPGGGARSVRRLSTSGATLPPEVVVAGAARDRLGFDLVAVDAAGRQVVAERGRHGAGCEVSGSAQLWTASLVTGAVHQSAPPLAGRARTQRFWDIDVSGPSGSIYASTFDCASKGTNRGRVLSTVLWSFVGGAWHRVGAGLVAADEVGEGPLATVAGDIRITRGAAGVTGEGAVRVAGRVVATGGQALAWSPDLDPAPA